jgi:hypothetical protein
MMPEKDNKRSDLTHEPEGRFKKMKRKRNRKTEEINPEEPRLMAMMSDLRKEAEQIEWSKIKSSAHSIMEKLLKDYKASKKARGGKRGIAIFDSKLLPLPEGVRPAAVDTRRMKFQIDNSFLEISMYPVSPGSCEIVGLLTNSQIEGVLSVDLIGKKTKQSVTTNEFHLFRIPRVEFGSYILRILNGRKLVARVKLDL